MFKCKELKVSIWVKLMALWYVTNYDVLGTASRLIEIHRWAFHLHTIEIAVSEGLLTVVHPSGHALLLCEAAVFAKFLSRQRWSFANMMIPRYWAGITIFQHWLEERDVRMLALNTSLINHMKIIDIFCQLIFREVIYDWFCTLVLHTHNHTISYICSSTLVKKWAFLFLFVSSVILAMLQISFGS